jgi:hypothetical protein
VRLVHRLVRQHRLADDVADGEDVRHVGAHLHVHRDEAAIADDHAGLLGADLLAVGRAAHGLQHEVVDAFALGAVQAFEHHADAVLRGLGADRLGLQHQLVEARRVELLPDLDEVAVGALHQAVEHLDHVELRAQRASRPCPSPGR